MIVVTFIQEREALPVWTLPFVGGSQLSADKLALIFAQRWEDSDETPRSFTLDQTGTAVDLSPEQWDRIVQNLQGRESALRAGETTEGENANLWDVESFKRLPPDAFVWLDEFKTWFSSQQRSRSPINPTYRERDENYDKGDGKPNLLEQPDEWEPDLDPMIPAAIRALFEGEADRDDVSESPHPAETGTTLTEAAKERETCTLGEFFSPWTVYCQNFGQCPHEGLRSLLNRGLVVEAPEPAGGGEAFKFTQKEDLTAALRRAREAAQQSGGIGLAKTRIRCKESTEESPPLAEFRLERTNLLAVFQAAGIRGFQWPLGEASGSLPRIRLDENEALAGLINLRSAINRVLGLDDAEDAEKIPAYRAIRMEIIAQRGWNSWSVQVLARKDRPAISDAVHLFEYVHFGDFADWAFREGFPIPLNLAEKYPGELSEWLVRSLRLKAIDERRRQYLAARFSTGEGLLERDRRLTELESEERQIRIALATGCTGTSQVMKDNHDECPAAVRESGEPAPELLKPEFQRPAQDPEPSSVTLPPDVEADRRLGEETRQRYAEMGTRRHAEAEVNEKWWEPHVMEAKELLAKGRSKSNAARIVANRHPEAEINPDTLRQKL